MTSHTQLSTTGRLKRTSKCVTPITTDQVAIISHLLLFALPAYHITSWMGFLLLLNLSRSDFEAHQWGSKATECTYLCMTSWLMGVWMKTLYLIRQITISLYQEVLPTNWNVLLIMRHKRHKQRDVQRKYGGSVWYQEPGHQLQKCGCRPPLLAEQPLHGLHKLQGHSVGLSEKGVRIISYQPTATHGAGDTINFSKQHRYQVQGYNWRSSVHKDEHTTVQCYTAKANLWLQLHQIKSGLSSLYWCLSTCIIHQGCGNSWTTSNSRCLHWTLSNEDYFCCQYVLLIYMVHSIGAWVGPIGAVHYHPLIRMKIWGVNMAS